LKFAAKGFFLSIFLAGLLAGKKLSSHFVVVFIDHIWPQQVYELIT